MEDYSGRDISRLEISDSQDVVSVEFIQHEKVKLILDTHNVGETIQAELLQLGCKDDVPCATLEQNTLHSDSQTFLTFTVHPASRCPSVAVLVSWMLVVGMASLLLTWMIRKWMKRKKDPTDSSNRENKLAQRTCSITDTKEDQRISSKLQGPDNQQKTGNGYHDNGIVTKHKTLQDGGFITETDMAPSKDSAEHSATTTNTKPHWGVFVAVVTLVCCIGVVVFGMQGLDAPTDNMATLRITFPSHKHIRHIRSYSTDPDIADVQFGDNDSASLVTRLQLLDLSPECRNNLEQCRVHALCDSGGAEAGPGGSVQCRCNRGFYLRDLKCIPCRTSCGEGFYMTQQCGGQQDVVCTACTHCSGNTYEVAACTSTQDAICIDVTFPLRQYQSKVTSVEELVKLNASMSKNVFLERIQGIKEFKSSLYMSSNKQELGFVWFRPESGLSITVRVSDTYLIPEYVDIDHIDDADFLSDPKNNYPQSIKMQIGRVRTHNCRHPLPDEYDLNMFVGRDKTRLAFAYTCDSQNDRLPACPSDYSDGDEYVYQLLKQPCPKLPDNNNNKFKAAPNSILCPGNSRLATSIFDKKFEESSFLTFPSEECQRFEKECGKCLSRKSCTSGSNVTDCCNKQCHSKTECKRYFSNSCPKAAIECSRGDILKFGIMPRFQSIPTQFSCHLKHLAPKHLYMLSYEAEIPDMNFSFGKRTKAIMYKNFSDFSNGHEEVEFLHMNHITESRYDDEVILKGAFLNEDPTRVLNYSLYKLKDSSEFDRNRPFSVISSTNSKYVTKIQFERPFLFSTGTWVNGGCDKNLTQIVPSQPIYEEYGQPVKQPGKRRDNGKFVYEVLSKDALPHIKFHIPENTSILSYYRDTFGHSKITPGSLQGEITWLRDDRIWNISIHGSVSSCPGLFTMEVYVGNLLSRLSVYDMLVNCPQNFSASFTLQCNAVEIVDMFIIVINDTSTSHRMVLSSIQGPQLFNSIAKEMSANASHEPSPWISMIVIMTVCVCMSLLLMMIYMYCAGKKSEMMPTDIQVPKPDLGPQITLLQNIDKASKKRMTLQTKCIMMILVALYVAYAFVFTFAALFALFHVLQGSSLNKISLATNVSSQIQSQMQKSLDTITEHENAQIRKMFDLTEQRLQACSNHLKGTLNQTSPNVNEKLVTILTAMFEKTGNVNQRLGDYFTKRHVIYQKEIDKFLKEFNRTLDRNLHKVQVTYASYLKAVAENNWLSFPKEIFQTQEVLQGRRTDKLADYLAEFLTWLEIDKVQEIFEIKQIVMNRVLSMMPQIDFSRLVNDTDDVTEIIQAFSDLDLKPSSNIFKFTYSKQTSRLGSMYTSSVDYEDLRSGNRHDDDNGDEGQNLLTNIRGMVYPIFIGVFLLLDVLLLTYRFSWLFKSLRLFKAGFEERVPYNAITKMIHFILTGRDVPLPEDSWDGPYNHYNMKENFWDDRKLYFLYCQGNQREKAEILREQLLLKQRQNPKPVEVAPKKGCYEEYGVKILKTLYQMFSSPVFWRLILICGFVLILCLVAKATNDLVTMESAMFLLDTDAMLPILERQSGITNRVIEGYGDYLNTFLTGYKGNLDSEVQAINNILVNVAERQSMLLNTVISDMCNLAGVDDCEAGVDLVTISLTSCNFLPVHIHPYTGFKKSEFISSIEGEVSVLVVNLRSIMFSTIYLLLIWACVMLLCQITARVIYVYLKNSSHLKRTKIYQLPSQLCSNWDGQTPPHEKELFENRSVIAESCESGVFEMTN